MPSRLLAVICLAAFAACQPARRPGSELAGTAEDLWNDKIELSQLSDGVGIIHPFSPSD